RGPSSYPPVTPILRQAAMALFGKDREHEPRGQRPEAAPPSAPAPREVTMFEREKAQPQETPGTSAFLGKGSRVNGKLAFEGAMRGAQAGAGKKKKPDFSALLGGQPAEDVPPALQPELTR